jgi:hypothetical protein
LRLKKKDKFAELNVGFSKRHVNSENPENKIIDFIEDGIFKDGIPLFPSHCFMTCDPDLDAMIGDLLAECILAKIPSDSVKLCRSALAVCPRSVRGRSPNSKYHLRCS